jgi:hypothetical protein
LYTTAPNSKQYFPGVKEDSMIPPALMSDCRAAELMSIVFLKCGTRIKLMGCNALSCLLVAMIIGSTTACVLVLQQHHTQHIIQKNHQRENHSKQHYHKQTKHYIELILNLN